MPLSENGHEQPSESAAAETLRSELGVNPEPLERDMGLSARNAASSKLGVAEADQMWLEGTQLTVDEAVEYGLECVE